MSEPVVQISNVSFRYGEEVVLDHVSADIQAGEFVGIIGPNGSGKTTLLKLILGLLKPESGEVKLFGQAMSAGHHASQIGYIPQKVTQADTRFPITVSEVVSLGRVNKHQLLHRDSAQDQHHVMSALKLVNMWEFRHRLLTDLSGGQQQRAFIAKALAGEPQLLVLDEPTVGIDIESQESFYELLAKLNHEHGLTIILVSHDVDVVVNEVSSVLCLNKTLIYHGNPKTFMKDDYLEKLYGKNRKFILHGH